MTNDELAELINSAANTLQRIAPHRSPTESDVLNATRAAGLPILNDSDSYISDPVRIAVVVAAFEESGRKFLTKHQARELALRWVVDHQLVAA